jgi:rare lipoprotein A
MIDFRHIIATLPALLAGCMAHQPPLPPSHPTYTIGQPFQAGNEWHYPREYQSYDETGLAMVIPSGQPPLTADQEAYDPNALAAQSPVLQLPCLVRITDLVNGRTLTVRVNGRGPNQAGRIIGVTPKIAQMLDFPTQGVVEVRVELLAARSSALDISLGAGPQLTAAPVGAVQATALPPPPGAAGSANSVAPDQAALGSTAAANDAGALSGIVRQGIIAPGPLYVEVTGFGSAYDARRIGARLAGMPTNIAPVFGGSRTLYALEIGPYHSVQDADQALQAVLARGVTNPEIIVR